MNVRSAFIFAVVLAVATTTAPLHARDTATLAVRVSAPCLPVYPEASELVAVGVDVAGRPQRLRPDAARAWRSMERAAKGDGVSLLLVSAFRSVDQQRQIFERKLRAGQALETIRAVNVPPGFSQHHAGTAVDVGTPGNAALLADFEGTAAFRWLSAHARDYGFSLSYPRGNPAGLAYEPWHWAYGQVEAPIPDCQVAESPAFTPIARRFHARLHGGAPDPAVTE